MLGCEQRHWGLYLQWLSEQAQENLCSSCRGFQKWFLFGVGGGREACMCLVLLLWETSFRLPEGCWAVLCSWSPHQQLPFVPIYFVSKLLVVPQQCFIPGSLIAASCLLLSFAVARSLPWLKDSWAGESSSPGSMEREGEQGGAGRGVCFPVPQRGNGSP